MKRVLKFTLIMICGLIWLPTLAQDDNTETYEFMDSSVTITFPSKWKLTEADDGHINLSTNNFNVQAYDSIALTNAFDFKSADSVEDALIELAPQLLGNTAEFDEDAIILEGNMARFATNVDDDTITIMVVLMSDGTFGILQSTSPEDETLSNETILMDILATFNSAGGGGLSLNLDSLDLSNVFCNVSTSESNSVQVRVGPGTNRTVVSFLPAHTEFAVLGKAEANDDSLWFKLNKEEAAPTKSVNETWILAESVTQEGDCDAVPDAAAPPIIPIIVQPTPNPDGTTDNSDYIIPTAGAWRIIGNDIFLSCANGAALQLPSELAPGTSSISGGGSDGLNIDGEIYAAAGPNAYVFSDIIVIDGEVVTATITFQVSGENSISGNILFVVQTCHANIPLTFTRL
jgi:hypothetical protein